MKIEHVRADIAELAKEGAQELLDAQEAREKAAERAGPPPPKETETYGIILREHWHPVRRRNVFTGEVIGRLPGSRETTKVWSLTREGVFAMCHRALLNSLTSGNVCDAKTARVRAAEAEFFVAL